MPDPYTKQFISSHPSGQSVSSTLPAFAKKGDLIIADEGVYEPLKTALDLSRSQVRVCCEKMVSCMLARHILHPGPRV